jgi:hypothetical protein
MAHNQSLVASGDIHKKHNWQNGYEDILLFSEKPTSYLVVFGIAMLSICKNQLLLKLGLILDLGVT